jgi:hypothetical protein
LLLFKKKNFVSFPTFFGAFFKFLKKKKGKKKEKEKRKKKKKRFFFFLRKKYGRLSSLC